MKSIGYALFAGMVLTLAGGSFVAANQFIDAKATVASGPTSN